MHELHRAAGMHARVLRRYTAITNFLAETEAYLNNLTETIMEKKLHEIKEKAFQAALADARAAGVPEEAAEQQALQAANEAAEKSEFQRLNENLAGDAQACATSCALCRLRRARTLCAVCGAASHACAAVTLLCGVCRLGMLRWRTRSRRM
jgi:predicted ArsR family transcriptional regulator